MALKLVAAREALTKGVGEVIVGDGAVERPVLDALAGAGTRLALDLLRRMLEIPSPPYEERRLAELLVETMADLGFAAEIDAAGNAVGETGAGGRPTVLLVGHMDTAPGVVPGREDGMGVFGRGAS